MTELYNLSKITDAPNLLIMLEGINELTNGILTVALYVVIGFGIIFGMYFSTKDYLQSMTFGALFTAILGIPLSILGLVPIYMPFTFLTFALFGMVIKVSNG